MYNQIKYQDTSSLQDIFYSIVKDIIIHGPGVKKEEMKRPTNFLTNEYQVPRHFKAVLNFYIMIKTDK